MFEFSVDYALLYLSLHLGLFCCCVCDIEQTEEIKTRSKKKIKKKCSGKTQQHVCITIIFILHINDFFRSQSVYLCICDTIPKDDDDSGFCDVVCSVYV